MTRINLLGGISHLPLFDKDDERAAAQKQREAIEVTTTKKEDEKQEEQQEIETKEEEVEEKGDNQKQEEEKKVEASDDKIEELEEELEDKTLTAKERERLEKRIQKEREKNKELRSQLEAAHKALAAKPDDEKTYTEEEVEARAEKKAEQKRIEQEFKASVDRIAKSCEKIDKDFSEKVTAMVEDVGGAGAFLPSVMVGILDELPNNGGAVLMHLANNIDEYETIHAMSPARMALKLKEISDNIEAKARKATTKQISKVPEPKDGVKGKGTTPEQKASEKDDMATWIKKRNKEAEEHRKMKLGYH